jgi:hypothetical protein
MKKNKRQELNHILSGLFIEMHYWPCIETENKIREIRKEFKKGLKKK